MNSMNDIIRVVQFPVITERLALLKSHWEQMAVYAEAMVATEENLQQIKSMRSDMRKEFDEVDAMRKSVKKAVLEPYERFEAVYKYCVSVPFRRADAALSEKSGYVEGIIKAGCEAELREYFNELRVAHHLDWLRYEQCGVKVDMASARAKTPKKLREQITAFVVGVSESVDRINSLDDAGEIMVEYQRTLDAAGAICTVKERHQRIEEAKAFQEQRNEIRQREEEAVRKVEALAPPEIKDKNKFTVVDGEVVSKRYVTADGEKIYRCDFTVHTTMEKLKKLKEFLIMEGIEYE